MKENRNIFFAGQVTGVEGYVESISSGFVAGINAAKLFEIKSQIQEESLCVEKYESEKIVFSNLTVIGALASYISTENDKFQPMNANFGILPELEEKIKDKKKRYNQLAQRAIDDIN